MMRKPVEWVHEKLGEETWSKQDEILASTVEHRKTGVWACHSSGKSHIASRTIGHWVDTHPIDDLFVVTSAPSAPQVRGILWRYLKDAKSKGKLPGYITDAEIPEWKIDGRLVGWGRKPANLVKEGTDPKAVFQGIHAKYVLVVLDEADGIPKWLWDAVETLLTSPTNRLLAIGNPDNPASHFATIRSKPDNDWHKITIAASDCPAFSGEKVSENLAEHLISREWVEGVIKEWGEDNALFISKVLAQYPDVSDDALITPAMIAKCIAAYERLPGDEPGRYSADVARLGKDKTVVYRNRGGVMSKVAEWGKKDTAETTERFRKILAPHLNGVPMVIDIGGGLGAAPFDRLRRDGYAVMQFDGSTSPISDVRHDGLRFQNRRAEQYWALREEMDRGAIGIDPADLTAQAQLVSMHWTTTPTGRIIIEKKEDIRKRTGISPDEADAIMMSTVETDEWELYAQEILNNPGFEQSQTGSSEAGDLLTRAF